MGAAVIGAGLGICVLILISLAFGWIGGKSTRDEPLAAEIARSMREERARWEAPDHGWVVDLYCRRDDGLEVMWDYEGHIRIQSSGFSRDGTLRIPTVRLDPWRAKSLHREMKRLLAEKQHRRAVRALSAVTEPGGEG